MFTVHLLEISIALVLKIYSLNVIKKNRESNQELANRIESGHLNPYPALATSLPSFSEGCLMSWFYYYVFFFQKHILMVIPWYFL